MILSGAVAKDNDVNNNMDASASQVYSPKYTAHHMFVQC